MALRQLRETLTAEEVAKEYPVTAEHRIQERRQEVKNVLSGTDKRLVIIGGPCSAWPFDAVREYADRYTRLQEEVREKLLLVLRCYIQKPRTTVGWPGPLNQPDPQGSPDILRGVQECRNLMCDVGKQLPLADEMLFTHNRGHFEPLLSYMALGARSSLDQEHRYVASGMDAAMGVKNPTSGDIKEGVDGVECVQHSHIFELGEHEVESSGNPFAHLILRGGLEDSNYSPRSIAKAQKLLLDRRVENPAIIVDASHNNSLNGNGKDASLQEHVLHSVMWGITNRRPEYAHVRGFMTENFLKGGKQSDNASPLDMDGLSITDACLSWEETEKLIRKTADQLDRANIV